MVGRPAARLSDPTAHLFTPLFPGTGSLNVIIGGQPAWRALPAGAGAALQSAQAASDLVVKTAEAATVAAAGTPGAPAALAAEQAAKTAAAAAMASLMSGLVSAAAASTGMKGGAPDTHTCPIPSALPPHGPGYVIDGSQTVLTNGLPQSRMGDTLIEALGGPDKIVFGMMNVLVGDAGSASGPSGSAKARSAGTGSGVPTGKTDSASNPSDGSSAGAGAGAGAGGAGAGAGAAASAQAAGGFGAAAGGAGAAAASAQAAAGAGAAANAPASLKLAAFAQLKIKMQADLHLYASAMLGSSLAGSASLQVAFDKAQAAIMSAPHIESPEALLTRQVHSSVLGALGQQPAAPPGLASEVSSLKSAGSSVAQAAASPQAAAASRAAAAAAGNTPEGLNRMAQKMAESGQIPIAPPPSLPPAGNFDLANAAGHPNAASQLASHASPAAFQHLPVTQRSVLALVDGLGHSAAQTAAILGLSAAAVAAALALGRQALPGAANAAAAAAAAPANVAAGAKDRLQSYANNFNARNFAALRSQLAETVRLDLVGRAPQVGRPDVSAYYNHYSNSKDWLLQPGVADGKPALLVQDPAKPGPAKYVMLVEWTGEQISSIQDFRFAAFVMKGMNVKAL